MLGDRPASPVRDAMVAMIGLGSIMVVALALRSWGVGDKSLWLDEALSWHAARLPLADMVDWTARDRHPPLYYALLHCSVAIFGDSEAGLRALSTIASAGAVAVLGFAGWRSGGRGHGLLACGLLALHPTHIEFAQEARMYPLLGLLALAASWALAWAIAQPTPRRFASYALLALATLYTHYSGVFVLAVHGAIVLAYGARRMATHGDRRLALGGLVALTAVAAGYAPWYPHLVDAAREAPTHLPQPSWRSVELVSSALLGLPRAAHRWRIALLVLAALGVYGALRRRDDPFVISVASLALVPCLQLLYSLARTPVLDVRQSSPYIPGFATLVALGLIDATDRISHALGRPRVRHALSAAGGAAVGALLLTGATGWYQRGPREDWRGACDVVRGSDTVYIWPGYVDEPLRYYGVTAMRPYPPSGPTTDLTEPGASSLVLSHETPDEAAAIIRALSSSCAFSEPLRLPGITVYSLTPLE